MHQGGRRLARSRGGARPPSLPQAGSDARPGRVRHALAHDRTYENDPRKQKRLVSGGLDRHWDAPIPNTTAWPA
jgi:hypothetical protein